MKVVYSEEALENLDSILGYIAIHYPTLSARFEKRLRTVVARIAAWPESAQEVAARPSVRMAPLIRYPYKPYKIFYRVTDEAVEILYIHHAAQQASWGDE
jgi:toxin ParE1/3/4